MFNKHIFIKSGIRLLNEKKSSQTCTFGSFFLLLIKLF